MLNFFLLLLLLLLLLLAPLLFAPSQFSLARILSPIAPYPGWRRSRSRCCTRPCR